LYTEEDFSISLGGTNLSVRPVLNLDLKAANTQLPINLISNFNHTKSVAFSGTFDAGLTIGVGGIPINLYVSASSSDITNSSGIDFHLGLDIDLFPVRDKIVDLLTKLNSISFGDNVIQDLKPFLPRLDFSCVSRSGSVYLLKNTTNATVANYPVSGFLDAIATGCLRVASFYLEATIPYLKNLVGDETCSNHVIFLSTHLTTFFMQFQSNKCCCDPCS